MTKEILFDDTYKGKRYTYGLKFRPVGLGQVPDGWIVWSDKLNQNYAFGTIDYPFKLNEAELKAYDLEEVAK